MARRTSGDELLQNEPQEGEPASERTEVRVLYDDEYLYVGVHAHDSAPGAIIVSDLWRGDQSAALSFNGRVGTGDFYDGTKQPYQFGPTVRLSSRLNSTVTWSRNVIALRSGEYTTDLIGSRINYSFSTRMFLNALLQYNTDANQWTSNVRFNIIHRPLSDVFFVYNDRRDRTSGALVDRAVIAKMTYMLAF